MSQTSVIPLRIIEGVGGRGGAHVPPLRILFITGNPYSGTKLLGISIWKDFGVQGVNLVSPVSSYTPVYNWKPVFAKNHLESV